MSPLPSACLATMTLCHVLMRQAFLREAVGADPNKAQQYSSRGQDKMMERQGCIQWGYPEMGYASQSQGYYAWSCPAVQLLFLGPVL